MPRRLQKEEFARLVSLYNRLPRGGSDPVAAELYAHVTAEGHRIVCDYEQREAEAVAAKAAAKSTACGVGGGASTGAGGSPGVLPPAGDTRCCGRGRGGSAKEEGSGTGVTARSAVAFVRALVGLYEKYKTVSIVVACISSCHACTCPAVVYVDGAIVALMNTRITFGVVHLMRLNLTRTVC